MIKRRIHTLEAFCLVEQKKKKSSTLVWVLCLAVNICSEFRRNIDYDQNEMQEAIYDKILTVAHYLWNFSQPDSEMREGTLGDFPGYINSHDASQW